MNLRISSQYLEKQKKEKGNRFDYFLSSVWDKPQRVGTPAKVELTPQDNWSAREGYYRFTSSTALSLLSLFAPHLKRSKFNEISHRIYFSLRSSTFAGVDVKGRREKNERVSNF